MGNTDMEWGQRWWSDLADCNDKVRIYEASVAVEIKLRLEHNLNLSGRSQSPKSYSTMCSLNFCRA